MSVPVGGPQVNRIEQVFSDHHQMSLEGRSGPRWGDPMSDVRGIGAGARVICTVRSDASLAMVT